MNALIAALIGAVAIWLILFGIVGLMVMWDNIPNEVHVIVGYVLAVVAVTSIGVVAALIFYTTW